jgi:hypothetical protein
LEANTDVAKGVPRRNLYNANISFLTGRSDVDTGIGGGGSAKRILTLRTY